MAATMDPGGVALQRTRAMKERETVMVQLMEGRMMVIRGARVTWCVAATTARSLDHTSMRKMIAARDPLPPSIHPLVVRDACLH